MIEPRGVIFIIISLILIYSGSAFYNMPLVMTGAIFIIYICFYSLYFNSKIDSLALEITREFDIKSAPIGRKIKYKLRAPKNTPYPFVLNDIMPAGLIGTGDKKIDSRNYQDKGNIVSPFYEMEQVIDSQQRGFYLIGPSKAVFYDHLNFFSREKVLTNMDNVLFYLTVSAGRKLDIALRKKVSEFTQGLRKSWYRGVGTNFIDLREYQPGDDIRLIDWKTTAKRGKLHVKEFEEEKRQRVLILLDAGQKMFTGSERIIMDSAIKAAMLISHISLNHGDYLGCATFSNTVKSFLKFDIGKKQYKNLINILSTVSLNKDTDIKNSLKYIKKIYKKNALIILISTLSNKEDAMSAVRKLRANGNTVIVLYPLEPLFSGASQANSDMEKLIFTSLEEKFRIDAWEIRNSFQKIGVPLLAVGPDDFQDKLIKQYIKTLNKNLQMIYS